MVIGWVLSGSALHPGEFVQVDVAAGDDDADAFAGKGVLVYLNANPDLKTALDKVEGAGGTVLKPKTQIMYFTEKFQWWYCWKEKKEHSQNYIFGLLSDF